MSDARDALLATVRAALHGAPKVARPDVPPWLVTPEPTDLVALFVARARAIGAEVLMGPPTGDLPPETVVTETLGAIAASGSIILEGAPRLPSALCEVHVAIVRTPTIVATLGAYLAAAAERPTPTARVVITGPSKTADIEGVLVTGVHGPRRLVIHVV